MTMAFIRTFAFALAATLALFVQHGGAAEQGQEGAAVSPPDGELRGLDFFTTRHAGQPLLDPLHVLRPRGGQLDAQRLPEAPKPNLVEPRLGSTEQWQQIL